MFDVFPLVQAKTEEYFGGVSPGAVAVVGFAAIDVDKAARVKWVEGKWDHVRNGKNVAFPLRISPEVAGQTRYLEFCYKGEGRWVLNLYSGRHPDPADLLASIPGQAVE